MTTQPKLRFFTVDQITAKKTSGQSRRTSHAGYFTVEEEKQLEEFCANIQKPDGHNFGGSIPDIPPHLRMFVAILEAIGAVELAKNGTARARNSGRLARHVPEILRMYIDGNYRFIDDWDRSSVLREDHLSAVSFIHLLEMRRIELSLQSGTNAEPLADRPVAFGVFRAQNRQGENCYLFELNRDWRRLNFVGGKQEAEDDLDFGRTLKREIHEEIGVAPDRVTLTRLNDQPIVGYGLSGNAGSLASYPCVLFGVIVTGKTRTRPTPLLAHRTTNPTGADQ
jgi:8-oxo-dGTP pyrophosphatase MutT (NUDIX family)